MFTTRWVKSVKNFLVHIQQPSQEMTEILVRKERLDGECYLYVGSFLEYIKENLNV